MLDTQNTHYPLMGRLVQSEMVLIAKEARQLAPIEWGRFVICIYHLMRSILIAAE